MCGDDMISLRSAVVVDADTDCTCLTPQRARSFPTQHNHDTQVSRGSFCSILILLRDVHRDFFAKVCVYRRRVPRAVPLSCPVCLSSSVPSGQGGGSSGLTLGVQKAEAGGRARVFVHSGVFFHEHLSRVSTSTK